MSNTWGSKDTFQTACSYGVISIQIPIYYVCTDTLFVVQELTLFKVDSDTIPNIVCCYCCHCSKKTKAFA